MNISFTLNWPQAIWLGLMTLAILLALANHGKPKVDKDGEPHKYNVWLSLTAFAVEAAVLYWGGFFS